MDTHTHTTETTYLGAIILKTSIPLELLSRATPHCPLSNLIFLSLLTGLPSLKCYTNLNPSIIFLSLSSLITIVFYPHYRSQDFIPSLLVSGNPAQRCIIICFSSLGMLLINHVNICKQTSIWRMPSLLLRKY